MYASASLLLANAVFWRFILPIFSSSSLGNESLHGLHMAMRARLCTLTLTRNRES